MTQITAHKPPRVRVGLLLAGCLVIVLATVLLACAAVLMRSWPAFLATALGSFFAIWPIWQELCNRLFSGGED